MAWLRLRVAPHPSDRLPYVYDNLGHTLRRLGEQDEALQAHQQALAVREELGDSVDLGHTYNNLGALFRRYGHLQEAEEHLRTAIKHLAAESDSSGLASAYSNLG